ncbi:MAG: DUF2087 domain-containing protein [Micromonosporaceae bacterium]|nr:DUF2087 domain-containing protein [Micromonosporaceae bacterium]
MRPDELCGLLAEPDRLAVFAAVVLGAGTVAEVAAATGRPVREVAVALRRLTDGGLVSQGGDGTLVADQAAFKEAVRAAAPAPAPAPASELDPDPARAAVLRVFIKDGRLVQLPAARGKRRVVLQHIAASFEPGVKYPERTVDAVLRAWHPDHATLRRYLVDEELMAREGGRYWRIGGPV